MVVITSLMHTIENYSNTPEKNLYLKNHEFSRA